MARHRSHSVAFKRQVAGEFVAGETLHALAKRHDLTGAAVAARGDVRGHETGQFRCEGDGQRMSGGHAVRTKAMLGKKREVSHLAVSSRR